jgi:hypothetical protein
MKREGIKNAYRILIGKLEEKHQSEDLTGG